jgi:hypothetical protein
MIIKPTIGRIVWLYQSAEHAKIDGDNSKYAAIVTAVLDDRSICVTYFPPKAPPVALEHAIPLVQEGDENPQGPHCRWMPYQHAQALKHSVDPDILKHAAYNDLSGER